MKVCTKCGVEKPFDDFHKCARDGYQAKCKPCRSEYALANRERISIANSRRYLENRDQKLAYQREYRKNNIKHIRERARVYNFATRSDRIAKRRDRFERDPSAKLAHALRRRLRHAIHNDQKVGSAVRDLNCSIEELKAYLEQQFEEGMSWDNWAYDGWHIDHIKPLHTFDLTDRAQFLEACHYTNLRPLWAKDNLARNRKYAD